MKQHAWINPTPAVATCRNSGFMNLLKLLYNRKRHGLIGDQEIPGCQNGLVQILQLSVETF
ncbi:unnamed protein product, partial [Vitis vinifera]|uniref:Uncharacterized protein n=1 Tax=Vitis vinifera TaxID=29760 RepID=E0CU82_VITVI